MRFPVLIVLIFGVVMSVVATPTGLSDSHGNGTPKFTRLLTRVGQKREQLCGDCLLWCRNRDLAEEFSEIKVCFFPYPTVSFIRTVCTKICFRGILTRSQVPYHSQPDPVDSLDFCGLRVKQWLETDLADSLNEADVEDQRIKRSITNYVHRLYCIENDYGIAYGKARDQSLFLNQVWSPRKLAALSPDQRAWVEKKLDERRRRKHDQGENNLSSTNSMLLKMSPSQQERYEDESTSNNNNNNNKNKKQVPSSFLPNLIDTTATRIRGLIPNMGAALRSTQTNIAGRHQRLVGPSFAGPRPAFPVFAAP